MAIDKLASSFELHEPNAAGCRFHSSDSEMRSVRRKAEELGVGPQPQPRFTVEEPGDLDEDAKEVAQEIHAWHRLLAITVKNDLKWGDKRRHRPNQASMGLNHRALQYSGCVPPTIVGTLDIDIIAIDASNDEPQDGDWADSEDSLQVRVDAGRIVIGMLPKKSKLGRCELVKGRKL